MNLTKVTFIFSLFICFQTFGANWYVNDNSTTGDIYCSAIGNDANPGTTASPKLTLAAAVASAASGDIIYVDAGTYTDTEVNFRPSSGTSIFTIIGAGTEVTIFDGSGDTKPFEQSTYEWELTLSDLTIVEYYASTGGAVFDITADRKLTLTDVVISKSRNRQAVTLSVGVSTTSSLTVTRGGFFCNAGGAVIVSGGFTGSGSLTLTDVAFIGNSGLSYGSALLIGEGSGFASTPANPARLSKCVISGCLFEDNTGTNTSTVYIYNKCSSGCGTDNVDYLIEDCIFRDNTVSSGGISYGGTLSMRLDNNAWLINHCLFDSNTNAASYGTLAMHTGNLDVTNSKFENNTTTSGEGKDFYSYNALTAQEASPYFLNDPVIDFNNCFFNSADDNITRNSSTAVINLVESGTPTNASDYSGDGLSQTYTWVDVDEVIWNGDCTIGYSFVTSDFYWVAGTGNWSDFGSHWSSTSGGSADKPIYPTSSSNVYFDANSDVGNSDFTVTMDVNGEAKNINYNSDYATFSNGAANVITTTNLTVSGGNMKLNDVNTTVSTNTDLNATLTIETATFNSDGSFDATGGSINFTGSGSLILSSGVTSLGTLDDAMGTVEYDGATQTVLADSYYNLSITTAGTKTAAGNLDVNGNLNTEATATCKLDMGTYDLNLGGNLTVGATDGLDLSDASALLTFDGSGNQTISHAGTSTIETTIPTINVASSSDDGFEYEATNAAFTTSPNMRIGSRDAGASFGACLAGIRFTAVPIPQGATISSATFDISSRANTSTAVNLKLYAEDVDDGTTFSEVAANFTSRSLTSSSIDWDISASWSTDNWYSSPDISSVIQEIVNKGGWSSGNDINIMIKDDGSSSTNNRSIHTNDSDFSPRLDITYSQTPSEFNNMTINKPSGNVILSSEAEVDGVLTLTSGDIDASSNSLTFTTEASVSGASDASHVIGTISKITKSLNDTFTFPVGDGTNYRPIAISETSLATTTEWTASYTNSAHPDTDVDGSGLDHISEEEYWDLDRTVSNNAKISLTWTEDNGVTDYSDLTIAHYDGSTDWDMITSTPDGTNTTGTVTSDAVVTTFSPFTIGSTSTFNPLTGAGALPIQLLSFEGESQKSTNLLKWTTASEKNNDYFKIEKTTNGEDFYEIGRIQGTGNSNFVNYYSLSDLNIQKTINYYRLIQVDLDGKQTISDLISIDNRSVNNEKYILKKTNLLGQEINDNYTGVIIIVYSDGSTERIFKGSNY